MAVNRNNARLQFYDTDPSIRSLSFNRVACPRFTSIEKIERNTRFAQPSPSDRQLVFVALTNRTLPDSLVALDKLLSTHVRPQSLRHRHRAVLVLIIL